MSNRTKGQELLDDFLQKLDVSLKLTSSKPVVTLEELQPAWDARDKLEKYLSTPQRDSEGKFLPDDTQEITKQNSLKEGK